MRIRMRLTLPIPFIAVMVACALVWAQSSAGIITTFAGPAASRSGVRAIDQSIDAPSAVAADPAGGFYFASHTQHRVYRVTADGILNFVAGTGSPGFSGDGGPAASAQLNTPSSLAVDSNGNLYISDFANGRIRRVSPNGVINAVAGMGARSYGGDGGPATAAQLFSPSAIAVDAAGNLYIADSGNDRIRKVTNGVMSTIAGGPARGFSGDGGPAVAAQLNAPSGIAVDRAGNVYFIDSGNSRVRKISPAGIISTIAGSIGPQRYAGPGTSEDGGPATEASFLFMNGSMVSVIPPANGIAVDSNGNVYVSDVGSNIRKVSTAGVITSVVETGPAPVIVPPGAPPGFAPPSVRPGLAVDVSGNLLVADYGGSRIRRITPAGPSSIVAGSGTSGFRGDGGPAASALLNFPRGLAMDAANSLYFVDEGNVRVRKVSAAGVISTVAGNGTSGFSGDGGLAVSAQILPLGIAVDGAGNLYIASQTRVRKVTPAGIISTIAGTGTEGFSGDGGPASVAQLDARGIAVDKSGNIYIADGGNVRVRKIAANGMISTIAGGGTTLFADGGLATQAQLFFLSDIAVDMAGSVYINHAPNGICRIAPDGIFHCIAGAGNFAVDSSGNVLVAQGSVISKITQIAMFPSGAMPPGFQLDGPSRSFKVDSKLNTTVFETVVVAGTRTPGFSGDGGPATSAQLSSAISGLAFDSQGNLYIADTGSHRIRKISFR